MRCRQVNNVSKSTELAVGRETGPTTYAPSHCTTLPHAEGAFRRRTEYMWVDWLHRERGRKMAGKK